MPNIKIALFCNKYGYTPAQVRYAIDKGILVRISRGVIDEDLALQALSNIKPIQGSNQSNPNELISALHVEIQVLQEQLQNALDLKSYYEMELNKLGVFPPQNLKIPMDTQKQIKKLSQHPILSQQWLKDQMKQTPESERIFKSKRVQIPQEAFLPRKK